MAVVTVGLPRTTPVIRSVAVSNMPEHKETGVAKRASTIERPPRQAIEYEARRAFGVRSEPGRFAALGAAAIALRAMAAFCAILGALTCLGALVCGAVLLGGRYAELMRSDVASRLALISEKGK